MYKRVATLKTLPAFKEYLQQSGIDLPCDDEVLVGAESPLSQPYRLPDGFTIGNRFCVHPMEGWDGDADGRPSELTIRRWERFGLSGAKLVWGGEAVAVCHEGRANPNQLLINEQNLASLKQLRQTLVKAHEGKYGETNDLLVGLQLTHSGRYSQPNVKGRPEPKIAYRHPYLDKRMNLPADYPVLSDEEIQAIIQATIRAAVLAQQAGFGFVDVKHCHGYLGHELLSARTRPGPYGGSFENRTRYVREIVQGIQEKAPGLRIGVRLSAFDTVPFVKQAETEIGVPVVDRDYEYAFGARPAFPLEYDLAESKQFLNLLVKIGVPLVNLTAGSPYYNPHIQRPAFFPPSDGYKPPEDPLVGVSRQVRAAAELKREIPALGMVGTGYSYLQDWLPNVAQSVVRTGQIDFVGLGRMMLSYPEFVGDLLSGKKLDRKRICRTFSDCTTAPRKGLVSGCYPLDEFYKQKAEAQILAGIKKEN